MSQVFGGAKRTDTAAVQLARLRGLRVIGTAGSAKEREFTTRELGAEACFDSRGEWEADVRALVGDPPHMCHDLQEPPSGRMK
jgi:NADPH-dependent curcumin reductase CurA